MTDRIRKILETVREENKTSEWHKSWSDKNIMGVFIFVEGDMSVPFSDTLPIFTIAKDGNCGETILPLTYQDFEWFKKNDFIYPNSYRGYKFRKIFCFKLDKVEQALKEIEE